MSLDTARTSACATRVIWIVLDSVGIGEMPDKLPDDNFVYFYHPDHLGSTGFVTDKDGELYEHMVYFPFGETWVAESSMSPPVSAGPVFAEIAGDRSPPRWRSLGVDPFRTSLRDLPTPTPGWLRAARS